MSKKKTGWLLLILYLALWGSFCGLEVDSFVGDLPIFQASTFILFLNVLPILLIPPAFYTVFSLIPPLRRSRAAETALLALSSVYVHGMSFLLLYKAVRKIDFDFYFLWYNTADALPAVWKLYAPWVPAALVSMAVLFFVQRAAFPRFAAFVLASPSIRGGALAIVLSASIVSQVVTIDSIRGSAAGFLYSSFLSDRRLRDDYRALYLKHIETLRASRPEPGGRADLSRVGDVVFFVKQESLNGLLLGPKTTPQLLRAAQDGILFREFYANSIQSLRGYECILCGVPPSLAGDLVDEYSPAELSGLSCLPRIFRALGYHSLYFFGGSRNPRIMQFASSIGFENVMADDIAQPGDTKFDWGYREDVFFTRVFEHLEKRFPKQKLFVFIDTGATNHTPFEVLDDTLLNQVPFPDARSFEEHLANTTFVQDSYFGRLYDRFRQRYGASGSLVVASDHAWPLARHKNNIYNERGAYEENFLIPMLFVPPSSSSARFSSGAVVSQRYSQMDILPTMLDLIGLRHKGLLGESFSPWLLADPDLNRRGPARTKISVQPYGGGFISAVRYPDKYLFDVLGQRVSVFNLQKDSGELSPEYREIKDYMPLIENLFAFGARDGTPPYTAPSPATTNTGTLSSAPEANSGLPIP